MHRNRDISDEDRKYHVDRAIEILKEKFGFLDGDNFIKTIETVETEGCPDPPF